MTSFRTRSNTRSMNAPGHALIVDDERDIRDLLVMTLNRMGLKVSTAANLAEARSQLRHKSFDLCITDMRLHDGNGIDLVKEIATTYPHTPVAMLTAYGNMDNAVAALKSGAFDFVSKPVDLHILRGLVEHALQLNHAPAQKDDSAAAQRLIGQSSAMAQLRATIAKVARSQAPVFIWGESGVGKEVVARTIHELGARGAGPFVPVNCGAVPTELMESEYFGHIKGSFTGAHADKQGLFQAAQRGTLFLDEVAELPVHMQVKLLRAIQEKAIRPLGAATEIPVDVRILSATHKNLADLVAKGSFRHDLYYRINVIELHVPALRERSEDLPLLASAILTRLAHGQARPLPHLSEEALDALKGYAFPGNVRELENILERALAMSEKTQIELSDLQLPALHHAIFAHPPTETIARATQADTVAAAPDDEATTPPLPSYIEQLERSVIQKALEENRWNKTKTAAQLGITFRALRYKLKKLGME